MKIRLNVIQNRLGGSFWFVPSLMTIAGVLLAVGMITLDHSAYADWLRRGPWLDRLQLENARLIVSTIAGSMITVTSLVFSLTLIALTLASQQLGPRLLSVFMRDRFTQAVLGLFVSTFLYSLLILAALSDVENAWSTPVFSILIALLLTVVSVGFLISFIHHLASSMQADTMVARIAAELARQVERLFPPADSAARAQYARSPPEQHVENEDFAEVRSYSSGYVHSVDLDALLEHAVSDDLTIVLRCRAGDFIYEGDTVAMAAPAGEVHEASREAICAAIVLGPTRTRAQDLEFAMGAIVEIALRALSPGVNDPYTAVTCIDRLGDTLSRVLRRRPRPDSREDAEGRLRIVTPTLTIDTVMDMAFNEIRQSAKENVAITLRLLDTLVRLGRIAGSPDACAAIERHAEMVERSARQFIHEPDDLDDVARRLRSLGEVLEPSSAA